MVISPEYYSYILVIVSHNIFISGFIYANENALHPIETNLLRGLATLLINFSLIKYFNMGTQFKLKQNGKYLLIRSGTICLHSLTLALCSFYLPQPVVHTINSTGPVFVIIEDYFINGVKINNQQLKGIIVTFLGIILTINGESVIQYWFDDLQINNNTTFQHYASQSQFEKIMMGLLFAFMAVIWAYGMIVVKSIVDLNSFQINLHLGIFMTAVNVILYPIFVEEPKSLMTMIYGLLLCGAPMAIANIMLIQALKINKNTGLATICISSGVVVGYLLSILRYNQPINYICLSGSLCIVGGLIVTLTSKISKQKEENQQKLLDANDISFRETVQIQMTESHQSLKAKLYAK